MRLFSTHDAQIGQKEYNRLAKSTSQNNNRGLDGRHRDLNGQIRHKNGTTQVGTLRKIYGPNVAPGSRADMKLDTLLERTGHPSLSAYLRDGKHSV